MNINSIINHVVFSFIAIFFFILSNQSRRSDHAVSFFNIMRPIKDKEIKDIDTYNKCIANLYLFFGLMMTLVAFIDIENYKIFAIILVFMSVFILVLGNVIVLKKFKKK
ncbi:hypothetical protein [Coprobacillus cateniformis]|uniref:hypothetical protein n=1 Tax=Coprobacillaceae TaxID=2810280 RepID=UPI0039A1257B